MLCIILPVVMGVGSGGHRSARGHLSEGLFVVSEATGGGSRPVLGGKCGALC